MASPEIWQTWQKWEGHVYTNSPTPVLAALGTSLQSVLGIQLRLIFCCSGSMQGALNVGRLPNGTLLQSRAND